MIQIIKKLRVLLDKKQKRTMVGLIILMVISAFLQTAGVGMLVEVMQIVIDPEAVQHSRVAEACYEIMGVESYRTFSIIVMVLLILVFVVKNLFTYVQQKLTLSFVYTNQFRTSERMMRNYLRRGYEFYLNADTAVVQRSITSDVNNMYALILALLQLLSDSVVSLFVISYCFISSGTMTILMAVVLLLLMWLIKRVLKPIMYKAGKDNQDYYSGLFKWISQTVQGIKEVKISGKEQEIGISLVYLRRDALQKRSLLAAADGRLFRVKRFKGGIEMQIGRMNDPDHGVMRIASTAVHAPVSVSTVKTAPSSFPGPFACSYRRGGSPRNLRMDCSGAMPSTDSLGPVMPRSEMYPVPRGKTRASEVWTCVCVPHTAETRPSRNQPMASFSLVASACISTSTMRV